MSHTSAPVPPRFGAMRFVPVGLASRRPPGCPRCPRPCRRVCLTWEMRPPSQMLVPTCSMALTRPSTIGVLSGFSDGNASTAPLARRRATAVENNNKTVLLIPISSFSGTEEEKMKPPTPLRNQRGNNTLSLRIGPAARLRAFTNAAPQTTSENAVPCELRRIPILRCWLNNLFVVYLAARTIAASSLPPPCR